MASGSLRTVLWRTGQAGALLVMAVLGLADMQYWGFGDPVVVLLRVGTAVGTAVVWLPRHRQDSKRLPVAAAVLSLWSVLLSVVLLLIDSGGYDSFGFAEALGLLGVLFVVARRGAPQWSVFAATTTLAALGLLPLRQGDDLYAAALIGLILALLGSASIGGGAYLRTVAAGRQRAVAAVRAEQRAEFARDLHDFIAHHVTGIVVQAQGARFVAEQDPRRVLLALEQIEAAGAETMASMRRMVGVLRDPRAAPDTPLAPVAGVSELPALLEQFNGAGGTQARLHVDGELTGLPVEVSTSAYRVVMEALTNVRQHANGARVADVWLRRTRDWLLVRVADDGPPPRATLPRDRQGYGLVGLTERVRAVGGRITTGPGVAGGWVVDVALPLDREG